MKKNISSTTRYCFILCLLLSQFNSRAQSLAINTTGASANLSAMLDIDVGSLAAKKGLLIPRVTLAQRTAMSPLPAAAQGLLLYQTDGTQGFYYNTSTTVTPTWIYISGGSGGSNWLLAGNALSGATPGSPNEWLGSSNDYDWIVKTNNTERLRVSSAGKLGINSPLPTALVDIFGLGNTSATSALNVLNSDGQPILYARDDQRVGIRTMNPASTLTVSGEVNITGTRFHVDVSSNKVGINNATPNGLLDIFGLGSSSSTISLNVVNSGGQPILFARDDQRVGIHTLNPGSALTVAGDVDITGSRLHVDVSSGKVGINNAGPNALLDIFGLGSSSSTTSLNVVNSSGQFILYGRDDQHVGIATPSPNSTLSIAGSVSHSVSTQSASYSLTANDYCVVFTSGSNTCTIPAAAGITGRVYILVNHSTIALTTSIPFTTANATTSTTILPGIAVQLISDGSVWRKIN
jgi:hypothetical protein